MRNHHVVCAGKTGDGVEQYHDILLLFHEAFGLFEHHGGHAGVVVRRFIEGRCYHFGAQVRIGFDQFADNFTHFGHFFRSFVNQKHHDDNFGVVLGNRAGHVLQKNRLTGARRSEDNTALALTDGGEQVHHAGAQFFGIPFELNFFVRVNRGQVFKCNAALDLFRVFEVDLVYATERIVFVILIARRASKPCDGIANFEAELAN